MKKYLIIVLSIILVISVYLGYMSFRNKIVILDDVVLKDNSDNLLAIYVETSAESGVYEVYNNSTFPTTGYVFNTNKSGCVDANENVIPNALSYSNNKVIVSTKKISRCYIYFDKMVPLFTSVGTDSTTGLPVVRRITVTSEEFYDITNVIDYSSLDSTFLTKINYDSSKSILLAKYNLYVGRIYNDSNATYTEIQSSASGYGLQSSSAKGYVDGDSQYIGAVPFSGSSTTNGYWDPSGSGINSTYGKYTKSANNIYDTNYTTAPNYSVAFANNAGNANYSIAYYVEEYVDRLGIDGTGRLLTYTEEQSLKSSYSSIVFNGTTYWLGSAGDSHNVWTVYSGGGLGYDYFDLAYYGSVRPVIVVDTGTIS